MEIIKGSEQLAKWERGEIKKAGKAHYGITITKRRLYVDLQALNPYEKVIFFSLELYADKRGLCWPSMRELATNLNLHKNTIQKYIRTLEKKGFLKIKTKRGKGGKRFEYWLKRASETTEKSVL